MDAESEFLSGLIELQYGQDVSGKLKKIAEEVEWARGWPENQEAFWNAEAFMWGHKVSKEKRELIANELDFLEGNNLDLGCGAYSYIPSVGFDISEKMLAFNDNCIKRVCGNIEEPLPFNSNSFDSVTAVFLLNYVDDYRQLLSQINRVLTSQGYLMVVLYSGNINDWQRQKEVNKFTSDQWLSAIASCGFSVQFYEKEGLWFYKCSKLSIDL